MFHFIYLGVTGYDFHIKRVSFPENVFAIANNVDHDGMLDYVAFHLGLHCLLKNAFRSHLYRRVSQKLKNCIKILLHVRYKYFYSPVLIFICGQYTYICFSPEGDTLDPKSKSFTLQPQHRNILSFQVHASQKIMQYKAEDS